ncbi:MAG: hypothetical protein GYB49_01310 [Alphaproteobacteria bacterium]|nr:hypothetical protein [Hyphomonas sp.]MBR9805848.1 hypothetical protein [Alphaproteobacteria bacterium]|tara:strand:- start:646 stop:1032 length:387 start_codon:yes stop_codon:yes gene_type:complete
MTMPFFSLFSPMPGLPWYLLPIWPLIYLRILRLKAWFRQNGGPGSQMLWGVMWNGRIGIIQLSDDLSGRVQASKPLKPSARLAEALSGAWLAPWLDLVAHSLAPAVAQSSLEISLPHIPQARLPLPDT